MKQLSFTKRLITALLVCAMIVSSLTLFTACTGTAENGLSAYEIAVKNGFKGSEAEWLASLKGEDGKDGSDGKDGVSSSGGTVSENDYRRNINEALLSSVSIYCEYPREGKTSGYSAGSGVIYKMNKAAGSAYIITNYHVIYSANAEGDDKISPNIRVYLYGGYFAGADTMNETGIKAEFIGGSMTYDIAVLKVTDSELLKNSDAKAVKVANSNLILPGIRAIAIGNPEGMGTSVTSGVVSVESENITMTMVDNSGTVTMRVIRIDTAVNEGNSGGGLFNEQGELMGIVNAKTKSLTVDNIGYAIPSNIAVYCAENILDHCDGKENTSIVKCLVGITVQTTDSYAKYDEESGNITLYDVVSIIEVSETSFAKDTLKAGDILHKIKLGEGEEITVCRQYELIDLMLKARVGDTIKLTVLRDGNEVVFSGTFAQSNTTVTP